MISGGLKNTENSTRHHVTLTFLMLGEADSKKKGNGERNKGEDNDELLDPVAVEGAKQDQGVWPV